MAIIIDRPAQVIIDLITFSIAGPFQADLLFKGKTSREELPTWV